MQREFDPGEPEWMDRPQPVSDELRSDLRNLICLNRFFGSYSLVTRLVGGKLSSGKRLRILDLATGSADIPRELVCLARKNGAQLEVVAVDFLPATLEIAKEWSQEYPEIRLVQADARTFDPGEKFDGVICSLALHHFSEEDAVQVLSTMKRLSAGWLLAADLERSRVARWCIWLLTTLWMREPMTRNDARVSIRRAFSFQEFAELGRRAGWKPTLHQRFPIGRQAMWQER